eukprot:2544489-Prymnesium_polylepis.1
MRSSRCHSLCTHAVSTETGPRERAKETQVASVDLTEAAGTMAAGAEAVEAAAAAEAEEPRAAAAVRRTRPSCRGDTGRKTSRRTSWDGGSRLNLSHCSDCICRCESSAASLRTCSPLLPCTDPGIPAPCTSTPSGPRSYSILFERNPCTCRTAAETVGPGARRAEVGGAPVHHSTQSHPAAMPLAGRLGSILRERPAYGRCAKTPSRGRTSPRRRFLPRSPPGCRPDRSSMARPRSGNQRPGA